MGLHIGHRNNSLPCQQEDHIIVDIDRLYDGHVHPHLLLGFVLYEHILLRGALHPLGMVGELEVVQEVLPGEEVLGAGETLEGVGRPVRGGVVLQAGFPLEGFLTVRTLEPRLSELVGHLVFPHVFRVDEGCAALPTLVRPLQLVLGVDMTVQQASPPELHLAEAALVASLPQVDVAHVGLQVLLLVEPGSADVALEGFVS